MPEKKQQPPQKQTEAAKRLIARIAAAGPVTVADFMAEACAHYYAHRTPFGAEGDFTTAPEISQIFGEMIAACLADAWMQAGSPADVKLIELGPGRGTLAADVMRTLSVWPACKNAISLHLVETSATLREQQAALLAKYPNVHWHDRLEDVPAGFSLVVANEFFDALPINQYIREGGSWHERAVSYDETAEAFTFATLQLKDLSVIPPAFTAAKDGSLYEASPASMDVLDVLTARIASEGGLALVIDYGYAAPAMGDTLQSLRRHRFTKVLDDVGDQDITAHVDFSAFRARAEKTVDVLGAVTQQDFLDAMGIMARVQALSARATPRQRKDLELALYRLTAPSEMGHLFKVLGLTQKGGRIKPSGFASAS